MARAAKTRWSLGAGNRRWSLTAAAEGDIAIKRLGNEQANLFARSDYAGLA
jgi:hypothetical protein